MSNPFCLYTLPPNAPFCNREREIKELLSFAKSGTNVVLYSPRRYGKTSLVNKIQYNLKRQGAITLFADFFGVTSIDDVAARLAKATFSVTHKNRSLWKTALQTIKSFRPVLKPDPQSGVSLSVEPASAGVRGIELLSETMESLGQFIEAGGKLVHIALDEFQEIVELKEASQIEATMRTHIQHHKGSYFFIGSRRRVLLGIFNERQRPFFQSAINYELELLPVDELTSFVREQFESGGLKKCTAETARKIAVSVSCHPYYVQKLGHFVFELSGETVTSDDITAAMAGVLLSEKPVFEAILQGLSLQQKLVLRTIAVEPTATPLAHAYIGRHRLGSTGGVQHSLKQLTLLDLIEKEKEWQVVDPLFATFLKKQGEDYLQ